MRLAQLTPDQLSRSRRILYFEGGSVSLAEQDERFYVVVDESTLVHLLDEEDLRGVELVKIIEFDTEGERTSYLDQRFAGASRDAIGEGTL